MDQDPSPPLTASQLEETVSTLQLITLVEQFDILGCTGPKCKVALKFDGVRKHLKACHPTVLYSHPAVKRLIADARQGWLASAKDRVAMENSTQKFWSDFELNVPIEPCAFFGAPETHWACPVTACAVLCALPSVYKSHFAKYHASTMTTPPEATQVQACRVQNRQWRRVSTDPSMAANDPDLDEFHAILARPAFRDSDPTAPEISEAAHALQPFYKKLNWWQDREGMTFQEWQARLERLVHITSLKPRTEGEETIIKTIDKWFDQCFDPVIKGRWSSSLCEDLMRTKHWSEYEADHFSTRPFGKLKPETQKTYKAVLKMLFLYISRRYNLEADDPTGLAIHDEGRSAFLADWLSSIPDQPSEHAVPAFQSAMFYLATEASGPEQQILIDYNRDAQASLQRPSAEHASYTLASPASICKRISGLIHMFRLAIGTHIFLNSATCYEPKSTRRTNDYDAAMACAHGESPHFTVHSLRKISNVVTAYINKTTSSIKVIWTDNPITGEPMDGFAIKGSVVRIATIRNVVLDAMRELATAVDNLLPGLSREAFPVNTPPDNLDLRTPNYSYFDNLTVHVNGIPVRTSIHAFNFARDRGFTVPGSKSLFTEDFRKILTGKSKSFNNLLMGVIHVSQSMPARAPESRDILIRNEHDLRRQLYFTTGQIVVKRTHSKADTVRQDTTNLVHWWDSVMSGIILHYLAYIRPIEIVLLARPSTLVNDSGAGGAHVPMYQLFHNMGQSISSEMYIDAFNTLATRFMGTGSSHFATWRHITHALAESKIVDFSSAQERQMISNLLVMSANHTVKTANDTYGRTNLDIPGVATSSLNLMKATCTLFQNWIQWDPSNAAASRFIHEPRLEYRESSLALTSSMPSTTTPGAYWNRRHTVSTDSFPHTITASFQQASAHARKYLPLYLRCPPSQAAFKSTEQALAATLAIEGKKDILLTMPVGAGKTLVALLAALVDSATRAGFTILMVPLRALESQFVEECKKRNITATQWNSYNGASNIDPFQGVLVVSPEQFTDRDFQSFLQGPAFAENVTRVVVDEAHLCESWATIRDCMAQIGRFRPTRSARNELHHVQLIALTGTCPSFLQERIVSHLNIAGPNLVVINQPARNTTTKFVAEVYENPASLETHGVYPWLHFICKQVQLNLQRNIPNRALVYVTNKSHARQYSAWTSAEYPSLNSHYFIGDLDSQAKGILYDKWKTRQVNILFCTAAFGLGVDDQTCTVVLRIGLGRSTMGLIQESGRCGRAGGKSLSVTLVEQRNSHSIADNMLTESDFVLRKDFERLVPSFLELKTCLGATLADFLELPVSESLPCSSHPHITKWTYCTVCEEQQFGVLRPSKAARQATNLAAAREALTSPLSGIASEEHDTALDLPSSEKRPRAA